MLFAAGDLREGQRQRALNGVCSVSGYVRLYLQTRSTEIWIRGVPTKEAVFQVATLPGLCERGAICSAAQCSSELCASEQGHSFQRY